MSLPFQQSPEVVLLAVFAGKALLLDLLYGYQIKEEAQGQI